MHQSFSLKRVEALQAKQQRLVYLERRMPELVGEAKEDLMMACLFLMQSSLRFLKGEELEKAKQLIHNAVADAQPIPSRKERSLMRNLLLRLSQWNLEATSRLLNGLIRIHVLR